MKYLIYSFALATLFFPASVFAATYSLVPSSAAYPAGRTFTIQIALRSTDQAANAVSADLTFPSDIVHVVSLSKDASVIDLWVREPTFSNANGTIRFEGAILNPGYQGSGGKILSVTFRAVGGGTAQLAFASGAILANDGKGTNIITGLSTGSYVIQPAPAVPSQGTPAVSPKPSGTPAQFDPAITSVTHPSEDLWSRSDEARFEWHTPEGADAVQYGFDQVPKAVPGAATAGQLSQVTLPFNDMQDGAYYFHLRFRIGGVWTPTTHRRVLIDRTPPTSLEVGEVAIGDPTDPTPELTVVTTDLGSGIDRIDVSWEGGTLRVPVSAASRFALPALTPGTHDIAVRVSDRAGNTRIAHAFIHIEPITMPRITTLATLVGKSWPWSSTSIFDPVISGSADPDNDVIITFSRTGMPDKQVVARVNSEGTWLAAYPHLENGMWSVSAHARDERGAISLPTDSRDVRVGLIVPVWLWIVIPWTIVVVLLGVIAAFYYRRQRPSSVG